MAPLPTSDPRADDPPALAARVRALDAVFTPASAATSFERIEAARQRRALATLAQRLPDAWLVELTRRGLWSPERALAWIALRRDGRTVEATATLLRSLPPRQAPRAAIEQLLAYRDTDDGLPIREDGVVVPEAEVIEALARHADGAALAAEFEPREYTSPEHRLACLTTLARTLDTLPAPERDRLRKAALAITTADVARDRPAAASRRALYVQYSDDPRRPEIAADALRTCLRITAPGPRAGTSTLVLTAVAEVIAHDDIALANRVLQQTIVPERNLIEAVLVARFGGGSAAFWALAARYHDAKFVATIWPRLDGDQRRAIEQSLWNLAESQTLTCRVSESLAAVAAGVPEPERAAMLARVIARASVGVHPSSGYLEALAPWTKWMDDALLVAQLEAHWNGRDAERVRWSAPTIAAWLPGCRAEVHDRALAAALGLVEPEARLATLAGLAPALEATQRESALAAIARSEPAAARLRAMSPMLARWQGQLPRFVEHDAVALAEAIFAGDAPGPHAHERNPAHLRHARNVAPLPPRAGAATSTLVDLLPRMSELARRAIVDVIDAYVCALPTTAGALDAPNRDAVYAAARAAAYLGAPARRRLVAIAGQTVHLPVAALAPSLTDREVRELFACAERPAGRDSIVGRVIDLAPRLTPAQLELASRAVHASLGGFPLGNLAEIARWIDALPATRVAEACAEARGPSADATGWSRALLACAVPRLTGALQRTAIAAAVDVLCDGALGYPQRPLLLTRVVAMLSPDALCEIFERGLKLAMEPMWLEPLVERVAECDAPTRERVWREATRDPESASRAVATLGPLARVDLATAERGRIVEGMLASGE